MLLTPVTASPEVAPDHLRLSVSDASVLADEYGLIELRCIHLFPFARRVKATRSREAGMPPSSNPGAKGWSGRACADPTLRIRCSTFAD